MKIQKYQFLIYLQIRRNLEVQPELTFKNPTFPSLSRIFIMQKLVQNNMPMDEDKWNISFKFYENNNKDLPIKSFSNHSNKTKMNLWITFFSYCPMNYSYDSSNTTVYLRIMLHASWHTAEGNQESLGS